MCFAVIEVRHMLSPSNLRFSTELDCYQRFVEQMNGDLDMANINIYFAIPVDILFIGFASKLVRSISLNCQFIFYSN